MAQSNFPACLDFTLAQEGGYVVDDGGPTNFGITQHTYDHWREQFGLKPAPVRYITQANVANIYQALYWDAAKCDQLPIGIDLCVFDWAVNSGPGAVNIRNDIDVICNARLTFLQHLSTWPTYGRGWSGRVARCRAAAKTMQERPNVSA